MVGIILLAAGSSSRMGEPKQKLLYQGLTLLQHAVNTAINSTCRPIVVVLGSNAELMLHDISNEPVVIVANKDWAEGMASSIRSGLAKLKMITEEVGSVIIMLCDQPFVDANLLDQLTDEAKKTSRGIIACSYNNTLGAPALFKSTYFADLLMLSGQEGAKRMFNKYSDDVHSVNFDSGAIDIDTPADYSSLINRR